jgi:Zn-dependent protease
MVFISLWELFDIAMMSLIIGFIFRDIIRPPKRAQHPDDFLKNVTPGFTPSRLSDYWYAVLLVAPAIIFHEFGHKFTAIAFGLSATFHAAYEWLVVGLVLKLIFGFAFFVPAFTSIGGANVSALKEVLIAFAGPLVNLLFWLACWLYVKHGMQTAHARKKRGHHDRLEFVLLFKRINGFLFVFNMIPIPGFDGWTVFSGLYHAFF